LDLPVADTTELPLADTSDMIQLHQIFRDALGSAPELVGSVEPGDTERAEFVASYYLNVLSLLHTHHASEDELVTPRLLQRCPDQAATITRIAGQHEQVIGAIATAEASIAAWKADPTEATRAETVSDLAALDAGLTPHLDDEERDLLPIAASCINVAEWGELPAHGMRHFTGDKPWLIAGLVQDQLRPEQIAGMQAQMPPEQAEFWATTGQHLYREHQLQLHGS
jgi:hemerythrin-like domain-containing protein